MDYICVGRSVGEFAANDLILKKFLILCAPMHAHSGARLQVKKNKKKEHSAEY